MKHVETTHLSSPSSQNSSVVSPKEDYMQVDQMDHPSLGLRFEIINITFPFPTVISKSSKDRWFYVCVTDGQIVKHTTPVQIDGQSLVWNEALDGLTLSHTSQLTLRVFEKAKISPDDELLATFIVSYEELRSPQHTFLARSTDSSTKKKSVYREISFSWSERPVAEPEPGSFQYACPAKTITTHVPGSLSIIPEKGAISANDKWDLVRMQVFAFSEATNTLSWALPHQLMMLSVAKSIPKTIPEEVRINKDIMDLFEAILNALRLTPGHESLNATELRFLCEQSEKRREAVNRMMDLVTECGYFIQSCMKDIDFWKGLERGLAIEEIKNPVSKFREQLKQIHDAFINDGDTVNVDVNIRTLEKVDSMANRLEDHDLDTKFPLVRGARFNPEKGCFPGTRRRFLTAITRWMNDTSPSCPKALVLFGQAGMGKSSIAHEIAYQFHASDQLTTSYCFIRGCSSGLEPHRFFTTLARNLCVRYPAFKASLCTITRKNPDLLAAEDYTTLFKSLIVDPLKGLHFIGPIVIVIDALDECKGADGRGRHTGGNRIPFHSFLGQHLHELPSKFRILMTSRPEPHILASFPPSPYLLHMQIDDSELSREVDDDILTYLRVKLRGAGVDELSLVELARKAERLFQWASVASEYVVNSPPGLSSMQCIHRVLHPTDGRKGLNPLDTLYMTVLERFDMDDQEVHDGFQSVIGQILGAYQPLSTTSHNMIHRHAVDRATRSTIQDISVVIEHLASLLSNVSPVNSTIPIALLHTSFRDFLTDSKRSHKFHINMDAAHNQLATATLRTMQAMLRFNICELETSYYFNSNIPNLNDRIEKHIPSALSYSCRFWADHLALVSHFDAELFKCVKTLIEKKFLFWLEILSLEEELITATPTLLRLKTWLGQMRDKASNVQREEIHDLDALVKDAIAFVRYFGCPISQSAPHIYLSALPFAPSSSLIAKLYSPQFPRTLDFKQGRLTKWPPLVMNISVPTKLCPEIVCLAWSWNDEYVAAGLEDGSVIIWNATTGTRVTALSAGKNARLSDGRRKRSVFVSSVAFSHDGLCLASGLSNGKIQIWELTTGQEVRVLKANYSGAVSALCFSQDSRQLVAGSADHFIRTWDLEKGQTVAFFAGHRNPVWAVSFLPDGEHVLSRSGFRTVSVGNVKTGTYPLEELETPTGKIHSTVHYYCEDEARRYDYPFRKSGFIPYSWTKCLNSTEKKYVDSRKYWVHSGAFSRDGKFVATSSPRHIRVWYAKGESAGKLAGGPFSDGSVSCLAFSGDGQRLASGSPRGVDIWNVGLVDEDGSSSAKKESPVSVAFSPESGLITVGRQYGTVEVLNASTGQEVLKIKERNESTEPPIVAVSPNGNLVAVAWDKEMHIWTRTGSVVAGPLKAAYGPDRWISSVAFSPDSGRVAFGTEGGVVHVFEALTGVLIAGKQHSDVRVSVLAVSPSTTQLRLAVWLYNGLFIWSAHSDCLKGPFSTDPRSVDALLFSADTVHITAVNPGGHLCVWDPMTGNIVRGPTRLSDDQKVYARQGLVYGALAENGRRVAFVGDHYTILVFEVIYNGESDMSLQGPLVLAGHTNALSDITFSRDGRFLATSSFDCAIRIWDMAQAMVDHKKVHIDPPSSDELDIASFNEVFIDDDGWAIYPRPNGGLPLRLMHIPEMYRNSIHRPNMCLGLQKESWLDFENFVHGKDWVNCNATL